LGDPQQLKRPQQGSHPEGTDVSALEHLLVEHEIVPPKRGVFLGQTHRLHPNVCAVVAPIDEALFVLPARVGGEQSATRLPRGVQSVEDHGQGAASSPWMF
jgi:hypothetical protein